MLQIIRDSKISVVVDLAWIGHASSPKLIDPRKLVGPGLLYSLGEYNQSKQEVLVPRFMKGRSTICDPVAFYIEKQDFNTSFMRLVDEMDEVGFDVRPVRHYRNDFIGEKGNTPFHDLYNQSIADEVMKKLTSSDVDEVIALVGADTILKIKGSTRELKKLHLITNGVTSLQAKTVRFFQDQTVQIFKDFLRTGT